MFVYSRSLKYWIHSKSLHFLTWQCSIILNILVWGLSWPWSHGSWIYNYLCNQCLSPLMLWVRISIRARCTTLYDKVCQWLATAQWFSPGPAVSSTNKTDHHDITEILLKVALNTIKPTSLNIPLCFSFSICILVVTTVQVYQLSLTSLSKLQVY